MGRNEFSPAFSTAFDSVAEDGVQDFCYPDSTDWACAYTEEEIAELDPGVRARSEALAWSTLASLTGYQVATCPVTVRPCTQKCMQTTWQTWSITSTGSQSSFQPGINAQGQWVNSCGCGRPTDCSCTALSVVPLPGPVGGIVNVVVDGLSVPGQYYRVDNNNQLVGQFGYTFPACQDMTVPDEEVGAFSVTYWRGFPPNSLTNYAAGVLAAEFYKACTGGACRLPAGVTQISRQGVTMQVQTGMWQGGWTGIREVDAIIATFNPYGLRSPTVITSPDVQQTRMTTWRW